MTAPLGLKSRGFQGEHTLKFQVAVLGVGPDASGTVPASGPCHVAHLGEAQQLPGPTKVLVHAFNVLRGRLPPTTAYTELSKNQERVLPPVAMDTIYSTDRQEYSSLIVPSTTVFCWQSQHEALPRWGNALLSTGTEVPRLYERFL